MIHPNEKYDTSPLPLKITAWLSLIACGFVIFHTAMLWTNFNPQRWVQEVYFNLLCGLPFFLFLTGTLIHDRRLRIPTALFFTVFFIAYVVNIFNAWEVVSVGRLQYVLGVALLGLFVTYCIHFFRKQKDALEYIKMAWFICISYSFLAQRFVPGGGKAGYFLLGSMILFPILMGAGFVKYFRRNKAVS
jgi:hypothetical protein